ncbi:uncharacterized protein LOC133629177 [Colius striatus]|uniref:uncharacterized protein LOC133629177 n=1 Tax=Colius striatus TaxID=57412 RepID=UPI002B1E20A5|nr:uncharacterized protein LOC133629177 [Colius striatus]
MRPMHACVRVMRSCQLPVDPIPWKGAAKQLLVLRAVRLSREGPAPNQVLRSARVIGRVDAPHACVCPCDALVSAPSRPHSLERSSEVAPRPQGRSAKSGGSCTQSARVIGRVDAPHACVCPCDALVSAPSRPHSLERSSEAAPRPQGRSAKSGGSCTQSARVIGRVDAPHACVCPCDALVSAPSRPHSLERSSEVAPRPQGRSAKSGGSCTQSGTAISPCHQPRRCAPCMRVSV